MISCNVETDSGRFLVRADGNLTIERASELKTAFVEAFDSGLDVVLDLSGVNDADLSCIQLVCSACKSAARSGRDVWMTVLSERLTGIAAAGGFAGQGCGAEKRCLLAGGGHG